MSYGKFLSGLSQGLPRDIGLNLERLSNMIGDGIRKAKSHGRIDLMTEGDSFAYLWTQAEARAKAQNYQQARTLLSELYNRVVPWLNKINLLGTGGVVSEREAERGAGFWEQVRRTIGIPTEGEIYRPELESDTYNPVEIVRTAASRVVDYTETNQWVLPVAAGVVLLLILRR